MKGGKKYGKKNGLAIKSGDRTNHQTTVTFFGGFEHFSAFFGESDPNIMGTIQTGSVSALQKGLTCLCSSNGLVSAGD